MRKNTYFELKKIDFENYYFIFNQLTAAKIFAR
jgi:hypothetical protein